jgi:hypothetical protein
MRYTRILSDNFNDPNNGKDLIFKFFITFARFEFALKNSNDFCIVSQRGKCSADWDKFIKSIKDFDPDINLDLREACMYIIENPPKKQSKRGNQLQWEDSVFEGTGLQKLNIYIRRIRNNLFHGGKFNGIMIPDVSRNARLITSALIVLNNWIDLNQEIKDLFISDIR